MPNSRQSPAIFSPSSSRAMNLRRSSMSLHAFQGILRSPQKALLCNPCLRNELSPLSQEGHTVRSIAPDDDRNASVRHAARHSFPAISPAQNLPLLVGLLFARSGFCIIWIDHAARGSARCRRRALGHRGVTAFEIVVHHALVDLKANRVFWVVGLGPCRRGKHDRADRQSCAKQTYRVLHVRSPFLRQEIRAGHRTLTTGFFLDCCAAAITGQVVIAIRLS